MSEKIKAFLKEVNDYPMTSKKDDDLLILAGAYNTALLLLGLMETHKDTSSAVADIINFAKEIKLHFNEINKSNPPNLPPVPDNTY